MATTTISRNELARQESIQFIRPQSILIELEAARPSSRVYVFFDDTDITHYCSLQGDNAGTAIITDENGRARIEFRLPGQTFNTGDHEITVTESPTRGENDLIGSVLGSASATFSASGVLNVLQSYETTTDTKTIII